MHVRALGAEAIDERDERIELVFAVVEDDELVVLGEGCNQRVLDGELLPRLDVERRCDDVGKRAGVARPGGRIVMGNWIPGDPTLVAQILKTCAAYSPPPPEGFVSPMTWGIEANVVERFVDAGVPESNIGFARSTYTFASDGSPTALMETFRSFYGPTMNAFEAATSNGRQDELHRELAELFEAQNASPTPGATSIPATFLQVTVTI